MFRLHIVSGCHVWFLLFYEVSLVLSLQDHRLLISCQILLNMTNFILVVLLIFLFLPEVVKILSFLISLSFD